MFSSCSATRIAPTSLNQLKPLWTGVVFPVELLTSDSFVKANGCKFSLDNKTSGSSFDFVVSVEKQDVFVELPAGEYRISSIHCSPHLRWLLTRHWPEFHVYAGKISVFGPHVLYALKDGFPSKFRLPSKQTSTAMINSIIGSLGNASSKDALVSAYLGMPLAPQMETEPTQNDHIVLAADPTKKIGNWRPRFQSCYDSEHAKNELFYGPFSISAVYENGRMTSIEVGTSPNTYSNQFRKCIADMAASYRTSYQARILANYYF